MIFYFICFLVASKVASGAEDVDNSTRGPFTFIKWEHFKFPDKIGEYDVEYIEFPNNLDGEVVTSQGWRASLNYHFLAWYKAEENFYVNKPLQHDVEEWATTRQCRVGPDYDDVYDDNCWKSLDTIDKNRWISTTKLNVQIPSGVAFRSTCSMHWSCDFHTVSFPIYAKYENGNPSLYIASPHGQQIQVNGDGSYKSIQLEDSIFIYKTISMQTKFSKSKMRCLKTDNNYPMCNYVKDDKSIVIEFDKDVVTFNNYLFMKPNLSSPVMFTAGDDSTPATKGDLRQLDHKVLLENMDRTIEYHRLLTSHVNLINVLVELVNTVSKIDDHLIGRLSGFPSKSHWLNSQVFVLSGNIASLLEHDKKDDKKSCRGSYVYSDGRWRVKKDNSTRCSYWKNITVFPIPRLRDYAPIQLKDAPSYRNANTEYSGWTYLDSGKNGLDLLDPRVKYGKGDGLGDFHFGFNIQTLIMICLFVLVFIILISCIKR